MSAIISRAYRLLAASIHRRVVDELGETKGTMVERINTQLLYDEIMSSMDKMRDDSPYI